MQREDASDRLLQSNAEIRRSSEIGSGSARPLKLAFATPIVAKPNYFRTFSGREKRKYLLMIQKSVPSSRIAFCVTALVLMYLLPVRLHAQDSYQSLYNANAIQKHKIRCMTVEFFAAAGGVDSVVPGARIPDYRERFFYNDSGQIER